MEKLVIGMEFNRFGKWYWVLDAILNQTEQVTLTACHEDDGFKKFAIFEKRNGLWVLTASSTDLEAAEFQYNLTVNYLEKNNE